MVGERGKNRMTPEHATFVGLQQAGHFSDAQQFPVCCLTCCGQSMSAPSGARWYFVSLDFTGNSCEHVATMGHHRPLCHLVRLPGGMKELHVFPPRTLEAWDTTLDLGLQVFTQMNK